MALASANAQASCEEAKKILDQPREKWLRGTLRQQHDRVMATYLSYRCGEDLNVKGRELRKLVMQSMIDDHNGKAEAEEVVKYLVHYMNINHTGDIANKNRRDNYLSGQGTLNFIPRDVEANALKFIDAQAPQLSREGLAKVIAFDSIQGSAGFANTSLKYSLTPSVLARFRAEKNPILAVEILRAMDEFPPLGEHPAFTLVAEQIKGLSAEAILALFQDAPQVFEDADAGKNKAIVDSIRKKLLAELAKHTAGNAEAQQFVAVGIEHFLPSKPEDVWQADGKTPRPLDPDLVAMIQSYGANAPLTHFPKFTRDIEEKTGGHPVAEGIIYDAVLKRKTEELATVLPTGIDQFFKDFVVQTIHARNEGPEVLAATLKLYFRTLKDEKHTTEGVAKAVGDFGKVANAKDFSELLGVAKNAPAQALLREAAKGFDLEKRKAIYADVAGFEEYPASDAYNAELAQWKKQILDFAKEGRNAGSDEERRELIFKLIGSLETARSPALVAIRSKALHSLASLMSRKRLASDAKYRDLLLRLVNTVAADATAESADAHHAAVQAYLQSLHEDTGVINEANLRTIRANLAGALDRALESGNFHRVVNLYIGLRDLKSPTATEDAVLKRAFGDIQAKFNETGAPARARRMELALKLIDAKAREFDAEVGKAFFDSLRYDMNADKQPREKIEKNIAAVAEICLDRDNESFDHLRYLCGYEGGREIDGMTFHLAVQMLAPIVAGDKHPDLQERAEDLIDKMEKRAKDLRQAGLAARQQQQMRHPAQIPPSFRGVPAGNLISILCLKPAQNGQAELVQLPMISTDEDREKFCAGSGGIMVNPGQAIENSRAAKVPAQQSPPLVPASPKADPHAFDTKFVQPGE